MRRHQKTLHNIHIETSRKEKIKCTECSVEFPKISSFNKHFAVSHPDINIKENKLTFTSEEEFIKWKTHMEKNTASFYAAYAFKRKSSGIVHYFECNRSGQYKSRGANKRHLKVQGSIKMGSECPARIKKQTKTSPSGQLHIEVTFYSTHVGHQCEAGRLNLSKPEKAEIAGKLQAGVPPQRIMENISYNASPTKRIGLTKLKDIYNISARYGIDMSVVRCLDDVLSVDSWVKEMLASEENPILIYKPVGELNNTYPGLTKDDFMLCFMNNAQEQIYKLYGEEVFSIDSTHGTNKYNIQLTSIVVKDDNWEGFPVAFMWSDRQTEEVFRYFFSAIKIRIGNMATKTFMSDDYPAFYNAFAAVFGEPRFNLICDWHVKRAWNKNLSTGTHKVENAEKRQEVIGALYYMANETDEYTFKCLMDVNINNLIEDPDTKNFGVYFKSNYAHRTEQWAGCYRIHANINTNMSVERWHKELKYNSDLQGKAGGRMDKAIHSLIGSLRKKLMSRMATISRGKLTYKLATLRKAHNIAESAAEENEILKTEINKWIVPSLSNFGGIYTVERCNTDQNHSCNLTCQECHVCIHNFRCSCNDSSIKFNMCKHIHIVCIKNRAQIEPTPMEYSSDGGDLVIVMNDQIQNHEIEQKAISKELKKGGNEKIVQVETDRNETCSEILSLIPIVNVITSKEIFLEIRNNVTILKNKINAMSQRCEILPPIVSHHPHNLKVTPQRHLSTFTKRKQKKSITANTVRYQDTQLKALLKNKK